MNSLKQRCPSSHLS